MSRNIEDKLKELDQKTEDLKKLYLKQVELLGELKIALILEKTSSNFVVKTSREELIRLENRDELNETLKALEKKGLGFKIYTKKEGKNEKQ